MATAEKRTLAALALLMIFALALVLRFDGIDWALKDGTYSFHPDERHVENTINSLRPQGLNADELGLPLWEKTRRLYERNLKVADPDAPVTPGSPGLRPINYNYGTLPNFLYLFYQRYLQASYIPASGGQPGGEWVFLRFPGALGFLALLIAIGVGVWMYRALWHDITHVEKCVRPWHQDPRRLFYAIPCLLLPLVGLFVAVAAPHWVTDFSRYTPGPSSSLLIGRMVTAWAGAFTVLFVYLIGRHAYNALAGLIGAFFLATAMLHVQSSHFATVDVLLGFFATAACFFMLRLSQTARLHWYLLSAAAVACAAATKWSGLLLLAPFFIAHAVALFSRQGKRAAVRWIHLFWLIYTGFFLLQFLRAATSINPPLNETIGAWWSLCWRWSPLFALIELAAFALSLYLLRLKMAWDGREKGWIADAWRVYRPWVWFSLAVGFGLAVFFAAEPFAFLDANHFAQDMAREAAYNSTGEISIWYTQQFNHTIPVITSLDNLFYPSLDYLTAFFVVGGCLYALWRMLAGANSADVFLCAFVIPAFFILTSAHSKYPRYMLMVLPVMTALGGRFLADMIRLQPAFYTPGAPGLGFAARRWVRRLGFVLGAAAMVSGLIYGVSYVGVYHRPHTLVQASRYMKSVLKSSDVVLVNNVDEGGGFPNTVELGFHYAGPDGRLYLESANYYAEKLAQADYIIFRSKRPYGTTLQNPDLYPAVNQFLRVLFSEQLGFRIEKVFTNPPRFLGLEFRVDEEDETARIYDHPKVIVFKKNQNLSVDAMRRLLMQPPEWIQRIGASEILRVREGHPVFQHVNAFPVLRYWIALQLVGLIGFLLIFPLCSRMPDGGWGVSKIAGLALWTWFSWMMASTGVMSASPLQFALAFLALAAAAAFAAWRYRDDLRAFFTKRAAAVVGLELLFLAIWAFFLIVRAWHPAAAWGEKPMNFSFVNAVYRASTFPPEDPWISGESINYYYYGHMIYSLLGRAAGLDPEYLFTIGAASIGGLTALGVFSVAFALCRRVWLSLFSVWLYLFSAHVITFFQMVRVALKQDPGLYASWSDCARALGTILHWLWLSVSVWLGFGGEVARLELFQLDYDRLFWAARTIWPNVVANEFPYWTNLFADFHAHMLVVPFSLAYLYMLYAMFSRPRLELTASLWSGFAAWLALMLGVVTCTNTWDAPGLVIALALTLLVKWTRESELLLSRRPVEWTAPAAWRSLACMPLAPLGSILLLSVVLMLPFHCNFTSRVTSAALMTEGQTSLTLYLHWWAHLILPLIAAVLTAVLIRREGGLSWKRGLAFFVMLGASIALFRLIASWNVFGFPPPMSLNDPPLDYTVVGVFLPFLVVLFALLWRRGRDARETFAYLLAFVGLGLSLGIELVYIKEGWGRPQHRWNTVFKFNLQTWLYLSLFAPCACLMVWTALGRFTSRAGAAFGWVSRAGFAAVYAGLLALTLPFTLLAPSLVTFTNGAEWRDARGERPTLDALAWLRKEQYPDYAAVQWFQRFVSGSPNIVEMPDGYYNEVSRFSINTGLPTVIGWSHHVGERLHVDQKVPRTRDADLIYESENPNEVRGLLAKYQVDYLVFGSIEMNKRRESYGHTAYYGPQSLRRIQSMPDTFQLIYRYDDTSLFHVRRDLNEAYAPPEPAPPPAAQSPQAGASIWQGERGSDNGQFLEPRGLLLAPDGRIVVADTFNNRLQVFNPDGTFAWKLDRLGPDAGPFKEPNALTVDPESGVFYVADTWNNRLVLIGSKGEFIGASPSLFYAPRGIAFHPQKRLIYLCDTGNHLVKVMEPSGNLVATWGVPGGGSDENSFQEPVGVAVSPEGDVLIADSLNRRVKTYTADGQLLRMWPIQTSWDQPGGYETHLACAPDGTVFLTDPGEGSVHIYNATGELQRKIVTDVQDRPLGRPVGIALLGDGRVLVTDISQRGVTMHVIQ
ncbi:MAG: hypothetical protein GC154_03020 [bacterium]|nr:hypothetical protein [bacterium]